MGARTSTTARQTRSNRGRNRTSLAGDPASPQQGPVAHGLSVVHFDDDQDDRSLEDGRPVAESPSLQARDCERLSELIVERIAARTSGRIRDLQVSCERGRVTLRGQCATFYTKQLAQHAAMGVIEDETVVNDISVGIR